MKFDGVPRLDRGKDMQEKDMAGAGMDVFKSIQVNPQP